MHILSCIELYAYLFLDFVYVLTLKPTAIIIHIDTRVSYYDICIIKIMIMIATGHRNSNAQANS